MRAPYASVVLLSYNRPEFLKQALATLRATAEWPIEVVINDDGSSDPELRQWLSNAVGAGEISRLILTPPGHNEGRGVAMNRGLVAATGDPLIVADQDLVFQPGCIRRVVEILESAPLRGRLIPLYDRGGVVAHSLVDEEDYELASMFQWRLHTDGYAALWLHDPELYARGERSQRVVMLHQLLMQPDEGYEVDHLNRRRLDNRRANLRTVTSTVNRRNVGANRGSSSPYRNVGWNAKLQKWVAQGRLNGTTKHLGVFGDEREAAWAVEGWRRENIPDSAPDPILVSPELEPPIGLLSGFHYWHDPCDWRQTIRARYAGWEEHEFIMGSFMAIPRSAWEALGPFEEHSTAFAEDRCMQDKVTNSQLWVCATPERDLMTNIGYGVGPSTVVPDHGVVAKIHTEPHILGA